MKYKTEMLGTKLTETIKKLVAINKELESDNTLTGTMPSVEEAKISTGHHEPGLFDHINDVEEKVKELESEIDRLHENLKGITVSAITAGTIDGGIFK